MAMLDPQIKPRLCEAVCSIFPEIPQDIARYDLFILPDGRQQVKFALNLTAQELRDLIVGLGECMASIEGVDAPKSAKSSLPIPSKKSAKIQPRRHSQGFGQ